MTFEQFEMMMVALDTEFDMPEVFACAMQKHNDRTFSWVHDALMMFIVRFNDDGSIDLWGDCYDVTTMIKEPDNRYGNCDEFIMSQRACIEGLIE